MEPHELGAPGIVFVDGDVVADRVRGPETVDAPGGQPAVFDNRIQQTAGMAVEVARGGAVGRIIEDGGESAFELPGRKEERPVDERHQLVERRLDDPAADEPRHRNLERVPVRFQVIGARVGEREQLFLPPAPVLHAKLVLFGAHSGDEAVTLPIAQEAGDHVNGS